ncbi:MAG: histidine kinase dimerization/phosphoacceptor domain -containing protein, partial [Spirochaetota bacterium]|nr:histidine kinase dimerization/phosphoacceptor domain -containing protein [Spirochaetota bacterium]
MTRILVVDNNPMVLEFMKEVLSGDSRSVETVESGLEALDSIRRTVPDIIFVDLVMPQIDGKQLCRLFRANERTRESFIVIISAIAAEERNFDYTELADAYLAKIPFKIMKDYLLALVEDVERGNTAHYKDGIVGLDHIYNRDITKELLFTKHHMEVLLSSITDGFVELSNSCRVIFANDAALQLFDTPRDELITSYLPQLFPRETGDRIEAILDTMNGDEHILGEREDVTLRDRYLRLKFNTVRYGEFRSVILIIQDITEQKEAERIIRDDLQKKATLLKEVHHRVKNNLNVIASLLSLQTSFIDDETVRKHLTDSKSRVESMAL